MCPVSSTALPWIAFQFRKNAEIETSDGAILTVQHVSEVGKRKLQRLLVSDWSIWQRQRDKVDVLFKKNLWRLQGKAERHYGTI